MVRVLEKHQIRACMRRIRRYASVCVWQGPGGGRRSYYAGAIAPVRLGARRHQSAHGAQIIHVQPIRLSTTSRPNGE